MTKHPKTIVGLALLLAVVVLVAWWRYSDEPEYAGVKISEWIARYSFGSGGNEDKNPEMQPFSALGTNAIHYLIMLNDDSAESRRAFDAIDSALQRVLSPSLFERVKVRVKARLANEPLRGPILSPDEIRSLSVGILYGLRPDADIALPWIDRLSSSPNADIRRRALILIGTLARNNARVESLIIGALSNDQEATRMAMLTSLYQAGIPAESLHPSILEALRRATGENRLQIIHLKDRLGLKTNEMLILFRSWLADEKDPARRIGIATATCTMDRTQVDALAILVQGLERPEQQVGIIQSLTRMELPPQVPTPRLIEMITNGYSAHWFFHLPVMDGLLAASGPKDEVVPMLVPILKSPDTWMRIIGAAYLLNLDPNNTDALTTLCQLANDRIKQLARETDTAQAPHIQALETLEQAGTNATAAIPELKRLLETSPTWIKWKVEATLQGIQNPKAKAPVIDQ